MQIKTMKTTSKKGILPVPVLMRLVNLIIFFSFFFKKTLILWPLFMDGAKLPQD